MIEILQPIAWPIVFLVANVVVLLIILRDNRRASRPLEEVSVERPPGGGSLDPSNILGWEFEYARTTASEAMQDRHTMTNFYLLIVGVVSSGVVTLLTSGDLPAEIAPLRPAIGTTLFWLLCAIGWFYFLALIRLRQAWYDSARAMNRIKDFCIQHASNIDPDVLQKAFLWQPRTLPQPNRRWTVYHNTAMLIGFLNSMAFVAGGMLLMNWSATLAGSPWPAIWLVVMGLLFFGFHGLLFRVFLAVPRAAAASQEIASTERDSHANTTNRAG